MRKMVESLERIAQYGSGEIIEGEFRVIEPTQLPEPPPPDRSDLI